MQAVAGERRLTARSDDPVTNISVVVLVVQTFYQYT